MKPREVGAIEVDLDANSMSDAVNKKPRQADIDIARGIAIIAVVCLHSSGNASRLYCQPFAWDWYFLTALNRLLCFAVPLFIFLSCLLGAISWEKKPSYRNFVKSRAQSILWPYVVWSVIYWIFRFLFDPSQRVTRHLRIFGISLTGPRIFLDVKARFNDLVWGKAFFHLYFLVILFEALLIVPSLCVFLRLKPLAKLSFGQVLIFSVLAQFFILWLQHNYLKLTYPASTALWYLPVIIPAVYLGLQADWRARITSLAPLLLLVALAAGYFYFQQEFAALHHMPVSNYLSNGSLSVFSAFLAILVIYSSMKLSKNHECGWLQWLGRNSLAIYLIHPALITAFGYKWWISASEKFHIGGWLGFTLMILFTLGLTQAISNLKVNKLLFGR